MRRRHGHWWIGGILLAPLSLNAQPNLTGIWQSDGIGNGIGGDVPWTLTLRSDGDKLTGTVRNCASNRGGSPLSEAVLEGKTLRLKCTSDDGNRTLTLTGAINGDTIEFTWQKEVKPGASPNPRDPMFGTGAPPRFTVKRTSNATRPEPSSASVALQDLLDVRNYSGFSQSLPRAVGLTTEERQYFHGMLLYLQGHLEDAIQPLVSAVNTQDYSLTSYQVEQALETLGDTDTKLFQYRRAVGRYDLIDRLFGERMGGAVNAVREKRAVAEALQNVPAQTVTIAGDFTLNRSGLEYPVSIRGKKSSAMFDTGAAFSVVKASKAKEWGVELLDGTVLLRGIGAGAFEARPAVMPALTVGKAELKNVAVFVVDDKSLSLSSAILGSPVTSALGRLTFTQDTLTVHAQSPPDSSDAGVPVWRGYSSLLISLGTEEGGMAPRLFVLDTGSLSTFLTDRYLAEHRVDFTGKTRESARLAGLDGISTIPAYAADGLPLWFGSTKVLLTGQHVLAQAYGGDAGRCFGLIGQDLLRQLGSYTIDFRSMRFSAP